VYIEDVTHVALCPPAIPLVAVLWGYDGTEYYELTAEVVAIRSKVADGQLYEEFLVIEDGSYMTAVDDWVGDREVYRVVPASKLPLSPEAVEEMKRELASRRPGGK